MDSITVSESEKLVVLACKKKESNRNGNAIADDDREIVIVHSFEFVKIVSLKYKEGIHFKDTS